MLVSATITIVTVHGRSTLGDSTFLWLALIAQPLLVAGVACAGVLVSMRARSARQAHQKLVLMFFSVPVVVLVATMVLPVEAKTWIYKILSAGRSVSLVVSVFALLFCVDLLLLSLAVKQCKREKLILAA